MSVAIASTTTTSYLRVHGPDINPNPVITEIEPGQVYSFTLTPAATEDGEPRLLGLKGMVATKFIFSLTGKEDGGAQRVVTLTDGTSIDYTSESSIYMER